MKYLDAFAFRRESNVEFRLRDACLHSIILSLWTAFLLLRERECYSRLLVAFRLSLVAFFANSYIDPLAFLRIYAFSIVILACTFPNIRAGKILKLRTKTGMFESRRSEIKLISSSCSPSSKKEIPRFQNLVQPQSTRRIRRREDFQGAWSTLVAFFSRKTLEHPCETCTYIPEGNGEGEGEV